MRKGVLCGIAMLASIALNSSAELSVAAPVKADEQIVFFPTAGYFDAAAGQWRVPVHGWIFEPELGGGVRQWWRKLFDRPLDESDEQDESLLHQRLRWFMVDNERRKQVVVRLAGKRFVLPGSGANGHFSDEVVLPVIGVPEAAKLRFEAVLPVDDKRSFGGEVYLVPAEGLSIISDIDDTIKDTQVRDKAAMLRNTFELPFRAVPGMAETYRNWAAQGAALHYVSASPWQLYPALSEFMLAEGFPGGSFHLRLFRLYDESFSQFLGSSRPHKVETIRLLLQRYPQRRFVLVGDSGEQDPEIYGELARAYPGHITHIFIRNVSGEASDSLRYREAFRELPAGEWEVFRDAAELRGLGVAL